LVVGFADEERKDELLRVLADAGKLVSIEEKDLIQIMPIRYKSIGPSESGIPS